MTDLVVPDSYKAAYGRFRAAGLLDLSSDYGPAGTIATGAELNSRALQRIGASSKRLLPLKSRLADGGSSGFVLASLEPLSQRIWLAAESGVTISVARLAALFESENARKVQHKHAKRLNLILTALNAATQAAQMAMPGMWLARPGATMRRALTQIRRGQTEGLQL